MRGTGNAGVCTVKDLVLRRMPSARDVAHMGRGMRKRLPAHPAARTAIGVAFIAGGTLSFLPLLGFWMLPVGLVVLSVDFPRVRRLRRVMEVRILRRSNSLTVRPEARA